MTPSEVRKTMPREMQVQFDSLLAKINNDPALQSLLYDLDLLPEQVTSNRDFSKLISVLTHWPKPSATGSRPQDEAP